MSHWATAPNALRRRMAEIRVGAEVRRLREVKGITLRELARRVHLSPAMVSDIEHGRRSTSRLADIARLLDSKVEHFAEIAGVCAHCGGTGFGEDEDRDLRRGREG